MGWCSKGCTITLTIYGDVRGLGGVGPLAQLGGVQKVAPEPSPYMVMRVVWVVAL